MTLQKCVCSCLFSVLQHRTRSRAQLISVPLHCKRASANEFGDHYVRNGNSKHFPNERKKFDRQPERRTFQLSSTLAWVFALAVLALVPARVLHTEQWDPTNCVFEKQSRLLALSYFVGCTVMEGLRVCLNVKKAAFPSKTTFLGLGDVLMTSQLDGREAATGMGPAGHCQRQ